jgi:hypothetical protein
MQGKYALRMEQIMDLEKQRKNLNQLTEEIKDSMRDDVDIIMARHDISREEVAKNCGLTFYQANRFFLKNERIGVKAMADVLRKVEEYAKTKGK